MTVFSVWAGFKFLGVFSTRNIASEVYSEYQMAMGSKYCGDMVIFESELDDLYQGK